MVEWLGEQTDAQATLPYYNFLTQKEAKNTHEVSIKCQNSCIKLLWNSQWDVFLVSPYCKFHVIYVLQIDWFWFYLEFSTDTHFKQINPHILDNSWVAFQ